MLIQKKIRGCIDSRIVNSPGTFLGPDVVIDSEPATDTEIIAEWESVRNELSVQNVKYRPRYVMIRGRDYQLEQIYAAWSRELKRKVMESEEKRKLHAQKDVLDEWEGIGI